MAALQPDGKIVIVGDFQAFDGKEREFIARLNADGSLDDAFNPLDGTNTGLVAMALQPDGAIFIGGGFVNYNGIFRRGVARLANGDFFVVWPPGDGANKTFRLPIVDDALSEANETLTFGLIPLLGGAALGLHPTAVLTIIDNDSILAIPSGVTAAAVSTTQVDVAWTAASGADSYEIDRQAAGGGFAQIGTSLTNNFSDTTAVAGAAYRYRVRAVYGATASASSAADLATTILFADSPLTPGLAVKAVHLSELRDAVSAVRLLAGLSAATFTDVATAGTPIRAVHVTELRSALDAALVLLGLSTGGYTDVSLAGIAVKAVHFQELRDRVH
jgi:hypothetical protein